MRFFFIWLRNRWHGFLKDREAYYRQKRCDHHFRPVRVSERPGRFCPICGLTEEMTPEEFYAQFGEKIWQR